jgi:hypothetical protein
MQRTGLTDIAKAAKPDFGHIRGTIGVGYGFNKGITPARGHYRK